MTVEMMFNIVLGLLTAALWHWVRTIREDAKAVEKLCYSIKDDVANVKIAYETESSARDRQQDILSALAKIERKLEKIEEKLERKADK